ncbi:MAG: hypothetical protein WCG97_00520 [bacterium]
MKKSFRSIFQAIGDLFVLILPQRRISNKEYAYAFIVHPRDHRDFARKYPFSKFIPASILKFVLSHFWPVTLSKVTGLTSQKDGKEINGWVISVLLTAKQMLNNRKLALKHITRALILAKKKGAKIVGLGGLISSLTKGGLDLIDKVNINITTGHAYTAYNVTQNFFELAAYFGSDKDRIEVAIVGATGSVGSTSAQILARAGCMNITLVDLERKNHLFDSLKKIILEINPRVNLKVTNTVKDIYSADYIITATNAPEALITNDLVKPGAIIIDDAQPSDVAEEVLERGDVLTIEAGVVYTPNIDSHFNFGLKNKFDNFCCMAELLILSAEEWDKHYVINKATLDLVDEVSKMGRKLSFSLGQYQNRKGIIPLAKLESVRSIIQSTDDIL